jgi:DNA-directed RNA polymerase specialized sigma24 family protein
MATLTKEIRDQIGDLAESMRPMIFKGLSDRKLSGHTNDVVQEVYLAAATKFETQYDPTRAPLGAWINGIAQNQIATVGRRHAWRVKHETSSTIQTEAGDYTFDVEDRRQNIDEREDEADAIASTEKLLSNLRVLVLNERAVERTVVLALNFAGNISEASTYLGLTPDQLRDSKRDVNRTALVIRAAMARREMCLDEDRKVTGADIFDCLPAEGEEGSWTRAFGIALLRASQLDAGNVRAEDMVAATGYSFNTCRQYVKDAYRLLAVANTILISGGVR